MEKELKRELSSPGLSGENEYSRNSLIHPVVCVLGSEVVSEFAYPPDGTCDVLIFSQVRYLDNLILAPLHGKPFFIS